MTPPRAVVPTLKGTGNVSFHHGEYPKAHRNLAAPIRRRWSSPPMRIPFVNAFYGVIDYVASPAGMLAVAPIAIRALGIDRYGIWMVANSAISIGAIVASGFGDANIRYVAMARAA